jgi:predicted nucleic acid-binding Zn ribbon protein
MKEEIIKLLLKCAPRHRTRFIIKNEEVHEWITNNFPNVPLNIVADSLIKGTSPYCCVCGSPIKSLGKKTCSTACRSTSVAENINEIVNKRKETCLKKYGTENPSSSPEVIEKRLSTMVSRYGSTTSPTTIAAARSRIDNLNKKGRETLQSKYGVTNPGQLPNHRQKCIETLRKHYNADSYFNSQEFKDLSIKKAIDKWSVRMPDTISLLEITDNLIKQSIFENPNKEIKFNCTVCNTIDCLPSETVKWRIVNTGTPCSTCSDLKLGSKKQVDLANFIKSLNVSVTHNYTLVNNREIDVFCPQYNIGFEFDGLFWHNDLRIEKSYHSNKTNTANSQGIRLVHIFEDEWDFKQEIVKSRIRNLLGFSASKVYARDCELKKLDKATEIKFMNDNHIQGFARSSAAYGLYYNDTLVSAMSFSKPNKAKGQKKVEGHWELLRFCSILNTSVVGAAGKLLKKFINDYNPLQVLSFADLRWSSGDLYKTLGFIEGKKTAINYWYIKNNQRFHRFTLRKNSQDNQMLTEYENRLNQGYLRIWDCGSSKWIWNRE